MPPLLVLFFCSGACGLAYQVLWVRQLSFVFGVTAYAAGTVLAAFMAGLALGSWLGGPLLTRSRRPLAVFGVVELLIGTAALLTPWALDVAQTLYRVLYSVSPDSFVLQTIARFTCAFLVLLVPTVMMGLTLPLLSATPVLHGPRFSARVSALYAVNTAGAVSGALLTGFVLIGAVGVSRTFLLAATVNALVGLAALAMDRWVYADATSQPQEAPPVQASASGPVLVWWVMAASGFASLALEVVWFRLMSQVLDATTYAFTTTLAVVLVGIATGGALSARWLRKGADWLPWLTAVQVATALAVVVGMGFLTWEEPFGLPPIRALQRVIIMVLLPSLMMGISFPLLVKLGVPDATHADARARGRLVGRFYSVNVLGAIVGSLAGGFLIVPVVGTGAALVVLGAVYLVAALALAATRPRRPRILGMTAAGAAAFIVLASTLPDPFLVALRRRAPPGAVELYRDDGVQTAVTVYETPSQRTLSVGGIHQANDSEGMIRLHRQIGILPMALHPAPVAALVIGLGGGATAGAVSQHAGTTVQIVELSDSVRRAASFFAHATYDVLNQPNVRMRVDDGRNFLALSGEKFDVITADTIQPFHAGSGHLYSREYFWLVRQALKPGGLALQWIGRREKSHYTLIMRTFLEVFPDATLWLDGEFMVGSLAPLTLDRASFEAKLGDPKSRQARLDAGLDSFDTLRRWYFAGPRQMQAFVGAGPVLTDDRPLIEYHRSLPSGTEPLDISGLRGNVDDLDPPKPPLLVDARQRVRTTR